MSARRRCPLAPGVLFARYGGGLEEQFQSEGGLRRTLLLVERIHQLAAEHPDDVAVCLTADDIDAAIAAGKTALVIALKGAHGIGQDRRCDQCGGSDPVLIDPERATAERVVDHIEHLIASAGIDHVGVGPDFVDDYFQKVYGGWIVTKDFAEGEIPRAEIVLGVPAS